MGKERISLRIDKNTMAQLRDITRKHKIHYTDVIVDGVKEFIKKNKNKKPLLRNE